MTKNIFIITATTLLVFAAVSSFLFVVEAHQESSDENTFRDLRHLSSIETKREELLRHHKKNQQKDSDEDKSNNKKKKKHHARRFSQKVSKSKKEAEPAFAFPSFTTTQLWTCDSQYFGQSWYENVVNHTFGLQASPKNILQNQNGWCFEDALVNVWNNYAMNKDAPNEHFSYNSKTQQIECLYCQSKGLDFCVGYQMETAAMVTSLQNCSDKSKTTFIRGDYGHFFTPTKKLCLDVGSDFAPYQACDADQNKDLPFCNRSLSIDARVADLVNRIPTEEMVFRFSNDAQPIVSLQIPSFQWDNEGLEGLAGSQGFNPGGNVPFVSSFPAPHVSGMAYNKTLWFEIATQIGVEGRALWNDGQRSHLTYFAPVIDFVIDPRWGRAQETANFASRVAKAEYAINYIRGLQTDPIAPDRLRASAGVKHLFGYVLENWNHFNRFSFNAEISEADAYDFYLHTFEASVAPEGGSSMLCMCSYNSVNGIPSCVNPIMNTILRDKWKFPGAFISDCGAVQYVLDEHGYTNTTEATCKAVLEAGLDQELSSGGQEVFLTRNIPSALEKGFISRATLSKALTNQFRVLFQLGFFDGAENQPFEKYTAKDVNDTHARDLTLRAAQEGITLLKNQKDFLPIRKSDVGMNLALLGNHANCSRPPAHGWEGGGGDTKMGCQFILGDYSPGSHNIASIVPPIEALRKYVSETVLFPAIDTTDRVMTDIEEACDIARKSNNGVILYMGLDQSLESEGHDRVNVRLPSVQYAFVESVSRCAGEVGNPVLVVVFSGSPVDMSSFVKNPFVTSIIYAGYSGPRAFEALADIIFGAISPSGRLPHDQYKQSYAEEVTMLDYRVRPDPSSFYPGRGMFVDPSYLVYPMGFGLTYTTFDIALVSASPGLQAVSAAEINAASCRGNKLMLNHKLGTVVVSVKNTGTFNSAFSVLLFVQPQPAGDWIRGDLADFEKVFVRVGETKQVTLQISATNVVNWNSTSNCRTASSGNWRFFVNDNGKELAGGNFKIV